MRIQFHGAGGSCHSDLQLRWSGCWRWTPRRQAHSHSLYARLRQEGERHEAGGPAWAQFLDVLGQNLKNGGLRSCRLQPQPRPIGADWGSPLPQL